MHMISIHKLNENCAFGFKCSPFESRTESD
jgi:hypothetical protein